MRWKYLCAPGWFLIIGHYGCSKGLWRNGSASDSRSDGWAFESLWPHFAFLHVEVSGCVAAICGLLRDLKTSLCLSQLLPTKEIMFPM